MSIMTNLTGGRWAKGRPGRICGENQDRNCRLEAIALRVDAIAISNSKE